MTLTEKLGGRKFVLSVIVVAMCFVLVLTNQIQAPDFLRLVFGVLAVYSGANAVTKFSPPTKKPDEEPHLEPVDDK